MTLPMKRIPRAGAVCLIVSLTACGPTDSSSSPARMPLVEPGALPSANAVVPPTASELAAWIVEPSTLPPERVGKNNCTFPFGQNVPQWNFHADAGCWERPGPDGWTRNQFQRIHIPSSPFCNGGPGDANAIRVCRAGEPGQRSPCSIDPVTGSDGCARCVVHPTCHHRNRGV
jgi:hypothetical protein